MLFVEAHQPEDVLHLKLFLVLLLIIFGLPLLVPTFLVLLDDLQNLLLVLFVLLDPLVWDGFGSL